MISSSDHKWLKEYAGKNPTICLDELIARCEAGEPVAYIVGEWEFYSRPFAVGPGVLVPRPDTEVIIDEALKLYDRDSVFRFADFGSGSGCLGITLAKEFENSEGLLIEKSKGAFKYLSHNLVSHDLQDRLEIEMGSVEETELETLEMIIANPPYVAKGDSQLQVNVELFEPQEALFAGNNGLQCIESWLDKAMKVLVPGGYYIFEFGYNQSMDIKNLLRQNSLVESFEIKKDLSGIDRVAVCRSRGSSDG